MAAELKAVPFNLPPVTGNERMRRKRRRRCAVTSSPMGLPGPQNHRHWPAGGDVIDVDRQETALIVMAVEQRKLLMPVHHLERVVNVKRDRSRRRREGRAIQIDHYLAQPNDLTQRRRILPARYSRLGAQICSAVRQSPAGNLKHPVGTQIIKIVGIFIATGNGENARAKCRKARGSFVPDRVDPRLPPPACRRSSVSAPPEPEA